MSLVRVRAVVADPLRSSLVVLVGLGTAGLVALVLTWRGVAAQTSVADQVAFVASGGLGGVALLGVATGVVMIQARRLAEARRRAAMEQVVHTALELLDVVADRSGDRP